MRYRLETDHYVDDRILEAGSEVGDGDNAVHPWRYTKAIPKQHVKQGDSMPPSAGMIPLDDAAKKAYKEWFGEEAPWRDPTEAIPIQGTGSAAKAPAPRVHTPAPPIKPASPAATPSASAPAPQAGAGLNEPGKH